MHYCRPIRWTVLAVITALTGVFHSCTDPEERGLLITRVSPEAGGVGTQVRISGSGFGNTISSVQVFFNEKSAPIIEVSDTLIITEVPETAITGDLLINIGDQSKKWTGVFNVLNGRWTRLADMPGMGRAQMMTFAIDGKGYITGGTDNGSTFKELHAYDPLTNEWIQKAEMPGAGRYGAVSFVIDNKAYVGLGTSGDIDSLQSVAFYSYDPALNQWTQKADFPGGPSSFGLGFSIDGKGYAGLGGGGIEPPGVYQYDPEMDEWTELGDTDFNAKAGVGFVIDDVYYGGCSLFEPKQWWKYEPQTDEWTRLADVPFGDAFYQTAFSIGSKGYVAKGTASIWEYDPVTDSWTQKTAEPKMQITGFSSSFSIGNKGYVGGGIGGTFTTKFFEFDPQ